MPCACLVIDRHTGAHASDYTPAEVIERFHLKPDKDFAVTLGVKFYSAGRGLRLWERNFAAKRVETQATSDEDANDQPISAIAGST